MRSRVSLRLASLVVSSLLVAACNAERSVAPEETPALSNAMPEPTSFSVWAGSPSEIHLSWQDNSRNEDGFEVHRSLNFAGAYTLIATTGPDVTSYTDGGRAERTQYCYRVRAVRTKGSRKTWSTFSPNTCVTTPGIPAPPANVDVRPLANGTVRLDWTDQSFDELGFNIERAGSASGPWVHAASVGADAISYAEWFTQVEQLVCFRVLAWNSYGAGISSPDCTGRPAQPQDLAVTTTSTTIDLAWTDVSSLEDAWRVERDDGAYGFVVIATLPANARSFSDASTQLDTRYTYRVSAMRDGLAWGTSNPADGIRYGAPPAAPANVRAYPYGSTGAIVYWEDGSVNELGFRVERSTDGGATWTEAGHVSWDVTNFYDGGRVPEQRVCYRVAAFNPGGESMSASVGCTTPVAAPMSLVATALPGAKVELTWTDASAAEDGYLVMREFCYTGYYYYNYCYFSAIAQVGAGVTSWTDTGLEPGASHAYQVYALKSDGADGYWYSDPSNIAYANVLP